MAAEAAAGGRGGLVSSSLCRLVGDDVMTRPDRIISGGQTGADQAALFAARELGISTGGKAPGIGEHVRRVLIEAFAPSPSESVGYVGFGEGEGSAAEDFFGDAWGRG